MPSLPQQGWLTPLVQMLMTALMEKMPDSPGSYRRMAALSLHSLTTHSKSPPLTLWLVGQMLGN